MVKEEGTFEELSTHGRLFQKLMENVGKMQDGKEKDDKQIVNHKDPKLNGDGSVSNDLTENAGSAKKGKGNRSELIKKEERETGIVSWNVLMR